MKQPEHDLISRYLDESLNSAEQKRLNALLRDSPELRKELILQTQMHLSLADELGGATSPEKSNLVPFEGESVTKKGKLRSRVLALVGVAACAAAALVFLPKKSVSPDLASLDHSSSLNSPSDLMVETVKQSPVETYNETLTKLPDVGSQNRPAAKTENVTVAPGEKLSYNQHIRPILSENCFHCHGPDKAKQEGDIALHDSDLAYKLKDGFAPIVPGKPKDSEVITRIFDHDDPMPPTKSNRSLSEQEKQLLVRWIEEGAAYEDHWAFVQPGKASPSEIEDETVPVRNTIDQFIQEKLKEKQLDPSMEASKEILARRASLALTGLQPTPEQLQGFLVDRSKDAYEKFVDGLLGSEAYAERMTLHWLDTARYADTDGYQNDSARTNWPWRDWVIAAYRDNMPFDQFTIEQLAGDMLPDATESQILATAFNRNHRQNSEGGALKEEFFVENVIDRIETTSTVWLGLTTGCARCHDHKYDPISQREFFQMFAYFNNIGERGIGKGVEANPVVRAESPLRPRPPQIQKRIDAAQKRLGELTEQLPQKVDQWLASQAAELQVDRGHWYFPSRYDYAKLTSGSGRLAKQNDGSYLFSGSNPGNPQYSFKIRTEGKPITGVRVEVISDPNFPGPNKLSWSENGNFILTDVKIESKLKGSDKPLPVVIKEASATYEQDGYSIAHVIDNDPATGWAIEGSANSHGSESAFFVFDKPLGKDMDIVWLHLKHDSPHKAHNIGRLKISFTTAENPDVSRGVGLAPHLLAAARKPANERDPKKRDAIREHFKARNHDWIAAQLEDRRSEGAASNAGYGRVPVMVMKEQEGNTPAYLLNRGQYDDPDTSEELPRGVIEAIFKGEEQPKDRLEFARWLVSRENPITARVVVNRMWQRMMGIGLVKTSEDFGSQGELPEHQELLDWLAVDFVDSGWDVKRLYRMIVTSHAFRQSSVTNSILRERDPENRLLARGPRYRMDGFAIRDLALHASGLLHEELGGPPVKPYQPEGLWNAVAAGGGTYYRPDKGEKLYRKSMYTFWKRAVNPPRQIIFDASGREVCNVKQKITNTPLQALVLMNDETFIEAARHLAERMIREEKEGDVGQRLAHGYQLATGYEVDEEVLKILLENQQLFAGHFADHPAEAKDFLSVGKSERDSSLDLVEHASYAATAHLIFNMDETITLE